MLEFGTLHPSLDGIGKPKYSLVPLLLVLTHLQYPSHPKPNFSTQVQGLFSEYGLEPKHLKEVREIQLALGLVAAGEGICVVPESARTIQLPHLNYIPILDDAATSPIFLAIRSMDESEDIRSLFDCIYQVYDLEAIKYDRAFI